MRLDDNDIQFCGVCVGGELAAAKPEAPFAMGAAESRLLSSPESTGWTCTSGRPAPPASRTAGGETAGGETASGETAGGETAGGGTAGGGATRRSAPLSAAERTK